MSTAKFDILDAVRNAYRFMGREWRYLVKAAVLPLIVQVAFSLFVQFNRLDASTIEIYLWSLPATLLFSWFMFLEARLLLLDERIDHLPADAGYLAARGHSMKAAVIIAVLFNMAISLLFVMMAGLMDVGQKMQSAAPSLAGLFLVAVLLWGLPFGVLPIPAAVGYPVRSAFKKINSVSFSLRLMVMGMAAALPIVLIFQVILSLIIRMPENPALPLQLDAMDRAAVIVAGAPLSLLIVTVLTAASAFALKQVLGHTKDDTA